jgi:uncharacterized RDD family membrane protein YckC
MQRRATATAIRATDRPARGGRRRRGTVETKIYDLDAPVPERVAPNPARINAHPARRLIAFAIDAVLLVALGVLLGALDPDSLASLGEWGRIGGASVVALYFGIGNSRLCRGQTIGKRFLRIHVVGHDGRAIPFLRAFLRASVSLALFGWCTLPFQSAAGPAAIATLAALLGGSLAVVYLGCFNRSCRQSIHDLVARTWVTLGVAREPVALKATGTGHRVAVALGFAVALATTPFLMRTVDGGSRRTERHTIAESLERSRPLRGVVVSEGAHEVKVRGRRPRRMGRLDITAELSARPVSYDELANDVVEVVIRSGYEMNEGEPVTVSLQYGYDILIAQSAEQRSYSFPLGEWRRRVAQRAPAPAPAPPSVR